MRITVLYSSFTLVESKIAIYIGRILFTQVLILILQLSDPIYLYFNPINFITL